MKIQMSTLQCRHQRWPSIEASIAPPSPLTLSADSARSQAPCLCVNHFLASLVVLPPMYALLSVILLTFDNIGSKHNPNCFREDGWTVCGSSAGFPFPPFIRKLSR